MPDHFQPLCAAIVALYVVVALARSHERTKLARRLLLVSIAAWTGEDSLMHAFGAYSYAPSWSGFLDRTPALIPCIWPIVVHSAWELAKRLAPGASVTRTALVVGGLVFTDAAFIEPIAVSADLWSWSYEGPFGVPLIGVLVWAIFAAVCVFVLESCERAKASPVTELALVVLAPLATHALAVACWWGLLRWIPKTAPEVLVVGGAWLASLAVSVLALRRRVGERLTAELFLRVPGAVMFVFLLAVKTPSGALVAYAIAFVPPYLVLLARDARARDVRARPCLKTSPSCARVDASWPA